MTRPISWPTFSGGSGRTDPVSPAPRPPGQLVCGSTAAGSYSIEHGGQQEQHARDENRAAGQRDTKDSEHSASNQEQDPPAGPHGACEPHYLAEAGRHIRADVRRRVTDVIEHPGPLLRAGSHQILLRACLLPACRITAIRYQPAPGFLPQAQPPGHAARQTRVAARLRDVKQACRAADDRDVVVMPAELAGAPALRSMPLTRNPSWSRAPLRALRRGLSLLNGNRLRTRLKARCDQLPRGLNSTTPHGGRGL
jgi:hypothetical protein